MNAASLCSHHIANHRSFDRLPMVYRYCFDRNEILHWLMMLKYGYASSNDNKIYHQSNSHSFTLNIFELVALICIGQFRDDDATNECWRSFRTYEQYQLCQWFYFPMINSFLFILWLFHIRWVSVLCFEKWVQRLRIFHSKWIKLNFINKNIDNEEIFFFNV